MTNIDIKDKISSVAGALFMQNGIKSISMDEIASKLGMSKRTIYQHFSDKEDILVYFLESTQKMQFEQLAKMEKTLPTVIDIFLEVLQQHKDLESYYNIKFQEDIEKLFSKAHSVWLKQIETSTTMLKEFLELGIKQGVVRPDLNIEVAAFLLQDTNNTYLHASRMVARPFTIWELFNTMMINFIRGISTQEGLKIIDKYLNA